MQHQLGKRMVAALLDDVGGREIGQHRDAEQLQRAVSPAAHRRIECLAVERMHGEKRRPAPRDGGGGALDRRFDVEQLGVDEHRASHLDQLLSQLEPL